MLRVTKLLLAVLTAAAGATIKSDAVILAMPQNASTRPDEEVPQGK